jgi:hypothetical protein
MSELPQLFTARYLAQDVLSSGEVVPVRIGFAPPIVPISYTLEEIAESMVPSREVILHGEWRPLARAYWRQLDAAGLERIAGELNDISARRGNKPLVLASEDDLEKGHRDLRIVAAAWLEEHDGRAVYEWTGDGRKLHYAEMPWRVQPKRPKKHDRRWSHDKEPLAEWPLTEADLRAWIAARFWQFARTTPHNPHEYTHRNWGYEDMFFRVVRHIREYGRPQRYAGDTYTVYDLDQFFYWTMGDPTCCTVILNRKYHDPEKQARLAEERTGRSREELGLRITPEAKPGSRRPEGRLDEAAQPRLYDIDTKEEA